MKSNISIFKWMSEPNPGNNQTAIFDHEIVEPFGARNWEQLRNWNEGKHWAKARHDGRNHQADQGEKKARTERRKHENTKNRPSRHWLASVNDNEYTAILVWGFALVQSVLHCIIALILRLSHFWIDIHCTCNFFLVLWCCRSMLALQSVLGCSISICISFDIHLDISAVVRRSRVLSGADAWTLATFSRNCRISLTPASLSAVKADHSAAEAEIISSFLFFKNVSWDGSRILGR